MKTSVYSLLLYLAFITSSFGQDNQFEPQDSTYGILTIPNDFNVPLFYDGQLCHWVRRIFEDSRGNLWFGTGTYGVMRYDGYTLEYITKDKGFGGTAVRGIVEDEDGNVWFGTGSGISKYDGKTFTNYTKKDGLISNDVWSITIDRNGMIWIGTYDGLSMFDGNVFTTVNIPQPNVKYPTPMLSEDRISCIREDKKGVLWFGTDGVGIWKYDGKTLRILPKMMDYATTTLLILWKIVMGISGLAPCMGVFVGTMGSPLPILLKTE